MSMESRAAFCSLQNISGALNQNSVAALTPEVDGDLFLKYKEQLHAVI